MFIIGVYHNPCQSERRTTVEQEKHYRHELKYVIPYSDFLSMRQRLRKVMDSDPRVEKNGLYQIRSIYFDNSDDKALLGPAVFLLNAYYAKVINVARQTTHTLNRSRRMKMQGGV